MPSERPGNPIRRKKPKPSVYRGKSDVKTSGKHGYNHPKPPAPSTYHGTSDVQSSGPGGYNNPRPPAWVLQRQRLLRAAGYHVVVDGNWGGVSQREWNRYRMKSTAFSAEITAAAVGHSSPRFGRVFAGGAATSIRPGEARVAARQVLHDYRAVVRAGTRYVLDKARASTEKARNKPATKISVHDVVALTIDPVTGRFNPEHPHDVRLVQSWLKLNGHPDLKVDGLFGKTTFHALVDSMNAAAKQEQRAVVHSASKLLYHSGLLRAGGKPPPGFPLSHVPAPHELVKIAHEGGFTSELVFRWMNKQMRDDPTRFRELSLNFVQKTTHQREPGRARFLHYKPAELLERYGYQAAAYLHAGSGAELKRALVDASVREERDYKAWARSQGGGFFSDLVSVITWPGEMVRDAIVGTGVAFSQGVYSAAYAASPSPWVGRPGGYIPPSELVAVGGRALDAFRVAHPWWTLAFELTVDPLNFLPGKALTLPATATWGAVRVMERAGIRLAADGRISVLPAALISPAHYSRLAWASADDMAKAVGASLARSSAKVPYERGFVERFYTRAYETYKRATSLKRVVIDDSYHVVKMQSRRLFKGVTPSKLSSRAQQTGRSYQNSNIKLGELGHDVNRTADDYGPRVTTSLFGRHVYPGLRDGKVSLIGREGGDFSRPGFQLWSRGREEIRLLSSHVVAWHEAHIYAMNQLDLAGTSYVKRNAAGQLVRTEEKLPKELQDLYQEHFAVGYRENIKRAGSYFKGGVDKEFDAKASQMRRELNRKWDTTLTSLQHELEKHWDESGESLFDVEGRWVGIGGETEQKLRQWADESYRDLKDVENPAAGVDFTAEEMYERIADEIQTRQGGELGRHEMMRESGEPVSQEALEARLKKIEDDVWKGWSGGNGLPYRDNRPSVKVPAVHARIVREYADSATARGFLPRKPDGTPASAFDQEIRDAIVTLLGPGEPAEIRALARVRPGKKELIDLDKSLNEMNDALKAAEEAALPQILFRNGLALEAMKLAQRRLPRMIYFAANGATQVWKFSTLALRPGWIARNVVDNTIKSILEGVHDPAAFFSGGSNVGGGVKTVFDVGIGPLRETVKFIDRLFPDANVLGAFDAALETLWRGLDANVLQRIFVLQGVPVPKEIFEGSFGRFYGPGAAHEANLEREALSAKGGQLAGYVPASYYSKAFRFLWHITGEMPENYSRRVLYRSTYAKVLRETGSERKAFEAGRDAVERTLFDYSKVSAIEDNFRLFFPFIQFWRKNTSFWIRNFVQHPAFLAGVARYEKGLEEGHTDQPDWMRRYVNFEGAADVVAKVPGLSFLADAFNDFQTDPLNYLSFSPLYRAFKNDNPLLPGERAGMPFISALIDAFGQWGLGLNPFLRKPLELAGVLNLRTWQRIFPQTDLIRVFTKPYWQDKFGQGFDIEAILTDPLYEALGLQSLSELTAESYNQLVQREMAGQLARGETVSRERAQRQIDGFLQLNALTGYFAGLYGRRNTPEDLYLYQLSEHVQHGDVAGMTAHDWDLYRVWQRRKADPLAFDAYIESLPLIKGYYTIDGFRNREAYVQEHPQIASYVDRSVRYRLPGPDFGRTLALVNDTRTAIELTDFLRDADAPFELRKRMEAALITPQLRQFWQERSTPRKLRDKMLRGEFFKHALGLQRTYFAIPETDYDARSAYLGEHPELEHFWLMGNSESDDYKAIVDTSNAALREHYFDIVEQQGFDGAASFLHRFPFIFEFTKAADKVNPETGEWIKHGGRGSSFGFHHFGLTEHARDYLAVKGLLDWFFKLPDDQRGDWLYGKSDGARQVRAYFAKWSSGGGGSSVKAQAYLKAKKYLDYFFDLIERDKEQAYKWLDSKKEGASVVRAYFAKYGSKSEHAKAFLKVRKWLLYFFALDSDAQRDWLHGDSKGAKMVSAYFDRWAGRGPGKQAKHYRSIKKYLKHYYSLSKGDAKRWLNSGDPGAVAVLGYFNDWSKLNQLSRQWGGYLRSLDPELNQRLVFWQRYWLLPPDQRPAFVMQHAADAGVFVWGPVGADERHRKEQEFLRRAMAHTHLDKRTTMYLQLRPYIELLGNLSGSDRRVFLRANPELREYLDLYAHGSVTGDKRLDKLVEQYFKLPSDSLARSAFLRNHPQVQRYFDKRNPGDRAMHNLLEVYFALPFDERGAFVAQHPEIPVYFEKRRREKDNETAALSVFEDADPRLAGSIRRAHAAEDAALFRLREYQRFARLHAMRALELERRTRS